MRDLELWPEWAFIKLQECYVRGITPAETAALIGRTEDQVCEKARELGLRAAPCKHDSPPTAPEAETPFPQRIRLRPKEEPVLPGLLGED